MHEITVTIVSTEEAFDGTAEIWAGGELIGFTHYEDNDLMLRLEPPRDGGPRIVGVHALANALEQVTRGLAVY